ncbi:Vacuolar protein sorting-associated protein 9a [Trichoderma ghanense]|uniref:Vacuolar protein sorting-associated protein 9a n=1 Tax=Trichoderma ghanense TaxID=65468 RepID=A0ABY2GZ92_9HYPO
MSPPGPGSSPRGADASEVTCIQDPSVGSEPVAEPNKLEDQSKTSFNNSLTTTTSHAAEGSDALDTNARAGADHSDDRKDPDSSPAMTDKPATTTHADSLNKPEAEADTLLHTTTPAAPNSNEPLEPSPASPLTASTATKPSDEASGMRTSAKLEQGAGPGSGNAEAESRSQADAVPETDPASPKAPAHNTHEASHEATRETTSASKDSAKAASKPSALTIKATNARPPSSSPMQTDYPTSQLLAPEHPSYVDPTPPTPMASRPPSRALSSTPRSDDASPTRSGPESDDKPYTSEDDQEGSRSEIQSIMEQFSENGGPDANEVMSPRLEIASPMLGTSLQHPPRKSSLEPLSPPLAGQVQGLNALHISTPNDDDQGPPVPPKDGSMGTPPRSKDARPPPANVTSPTSPTIPMHRPPPPEPEPEPALPFDFHRFLEQLRNKKADPVARYLKSFLFEFGKRQWMVHEQVKIISDFLAFIANKMMLCEVWRDVSDAEFDNAREGMEKLVMNRLYTQTFSPAIPPPKPIPGAKPKRRGGDPPLGPGRRGQHQEDVERDDIITQKINIYGWVREEHLDIPPVGDSGRRFLKLAQQELLKIKSYRAPRDKIICVLNCCKVIFGLLKHNKSDSSADSFMPLLIYVVLQSNPEHLVSNVQYILRFRNQEKLGGEAGYYLSSLMGAVQFIENMDRTSLTITDDEFEKNVEAAVSAIAEKHQALSPKGPPPQQQIFNEKSLQHDARTSLDGAGPSNPRRSTEQSDVDALTAPITGLLRTIQNPLTTIGRMFSDDGASSRPPPPPPIGRPLGFPENVPIRRSGEEQRDGRRLDSRYALPAEEAAARQASAEVAEAQRLHRAEHANIVETLAGMFPDLDKDIISDVVYQKEGRVGLAVDACLALSA